MGLGNPRAVQSSADYARITSLPRRPPDGGEALVGPLTGVLRTPGGTMHLRPVQALALHDIGTQGGLLGPIRVGGGKTLISLLAPHVLDAKRPLLLLPAALVQKTEIERRALMRHWLIPRHLRIQSYEGLGRVAAARLLELYRPDLIVADEAHRLKNPRAACTRRVTRYMADHPETKFVAISGTMIKHSLRDFGHLAGWSLKEGSPLPLAHGELEEWADALDTKVNPLVRVRPGALGEDVDSARHWFRRRLIETPGVVSTPGEQVACSLRISALEYPVNAKTEENFVRLRERWEQPCGWAMSTAVDVWRCARELALGMHYVWDPRPPAEWLEARAAWAKFVREEIKNSMHGGHPLDSELQVVNAVDRGECDDQGLLGHWRAVRPTFVIHSKPVWHDDSALRVAEEWMAAGPGIVWVEHQFFARELARRTGASYFGPGGVESTGVRKGEPVEREDGRRPIIASVAANKTGRNLQMFSRNLVTSWPAGADECEQMLGRTHRDGQQADEVIVDALFGCAEHWDAWHKALEDARMHEATMGQPQKVLYADRVWPEIKPGRGPRWVKTA